MNLFEYIKSQLPQMPNVAIMRQLGASEELIEYIRETPWNTNFGIMEMLIDKGDGETAGEIWVHADGNGYLDMYPDGTKEGDLTTNKEYNEWKDIFINYGNYQIIVDGYDLNDEPFNDLLEYTDLTDHVAWGDSETISISYYPNEEPPYIGISVSLNKADLIITHK